MLYVFAGSLCKLVEEEKIVYNVPPVFGVLKTREWFNDPLIKRVIKEVDRKDCDDGDTVDLLASRYKMTPDNLCGGTKALCLIKFTPVVLTLTLMGENCYKYLFEMARNEDRRIAMTSFCMFTDEDLGDTKIYFENTDTICTNHWEFWDCYEKVRGLFD